MVSDVYFVSEVSPGGEVANLTSLWTFSSKLNKKAFELFTDSKMNLQILRFCGAIK